MIRPWVKVSLCQYEELKRLREKTGKPLSEIIREAVCEFVRNEEYPLSTNSSYLPKASRDAYRTATAYFPRSDWDLLREISKKTGKCKSELIREAVDEYFGP